MELGYLIVGVAAIVLLIVTRESWGPRLSATLYEERSAKKGQGYNMIDMNGRHWEITDHIRFSKRGATYLYLRDIKTGERSNFYVPDSQLPCIMPAHDTWWAFFFESGPQLFRFSPPEEITAEQEGTARVNVRMLQALLRDSENRLEIAERENAVYEGQFAEEIARIRNGGMSGTSTSEL